MVKLVKLIVAVGFTTLTIKPILLSNTLLKNHGMIKKRTKFTDSVY